ncbi:hypothetical protein ES705_20159 [subsurface metagenome]|nr:hypothetical protein [Methanosarcinales archaeon]
MKTEEREREKQTNKAMIRDYLLLGVTLTFAATVLLIFPDRLDIVTTTSWDYFLEMMMILPAVMVVMGLFAVWVSKETIVKYLGESSGIKGIFLAILVGALPTGPLYVAFPMASSLLKKGARISNIVIFLSAWACIKLPQELVELQFLGLKFMLSRLVLTILFVTLMGVSIEWMIKWSDKKTSNSTGGENGAGI